MLMCPYGTLLFVYLLTIKRLAGNYSDQPDGNWITTKEQMNNRDPMISSSLSFENSNRSN